jgi:hypothetical protein
MNVEGMPNVHSSRSSPPIPVRERGNQNERAYRLFNQCALKYILVQGNISASANESDVRGKRNEIYTKRLVPTVLLAFKKMMMMMIEMTTAFYEPCIEIFIIQKILVPGEIRYFLLGTESSSSFVGNLTPFCKLIRRKRERMIFRRSHCIVNAEILVF